MFPSLYNAIPLSDELYIRKNCPSTARIRKKRIFQLSHKPFTRRNSIKAKRYGICVCSKPREKNERKTLFRNRKIPSASVMNTIQMRIRRRRLIYDECGGRADRQASCHPCWSTSARQAAALVALLGGKFSKEGAWKLGVGTDTVSDVLTSSSSSSVPPAANDSRDRDISAANTKYIFVCIMLSLCRCPSWQEAATEWQQKKTNIFSYLAKWYSRFEIDLPAS